jgi:hypothetical protein
MFFIYFCRRDSLPLCSQSEQQRLVQRDEYGQRELQLASKLEKLTQILAAKEKQHQTYMDMSGGEIRKLRTGLQKLLDEQLAKDRKINDQNEQLDKQDASIQSLTTQTVELNHELDTKLTTLRTYDQEIQNLQATIRKQDLQLKLAAGNAEAIERRNTELVDEAGRLEARILALQTQIVERGNDGLATALAVEKHKSKEAIDKYTTHFFNFIFTWTLQKTSYTQKENFSNFFKCS